MLKKAYISPCSSEFVLDCGSTILVGSYGVQDYNVDTFDYGGMVFKQE